MTGQRFSSGRFSFNQATAKRWPVPELVAGCVEAGVGAVGLWRDQVADYGPPAATAKLVRDAGITVTSLCRGGFFNDPGWYEDNRRAIDEAATLGAPVLVLVSGGLPAAWSGAGANGGAGAAGAGLGRGSRDLDGARAHVGEAIGRLVPHAVAAGVRLAIEPLHPMFASDRCVVSTLRQALDLAAPYPAGAVGVCLDTYHLWWDDQVWEQIARAGREARIACFQLADWVTPLPAGVLLGRALPGEGCIEMGRFVEAVDAAGYGGPIEVEVFQEELWQRPGPEILAATIEAFQEAIT